MGKFEDEIKKKLEEGNMDYSPSSWDQMDKNLSEQPSLSSFEQKIQDSLSNASVPLSVNAWENFNENFNAPDQFEQSIQDKLKDGEVELNTNHWEQFSEKLAESKLTPFEKGVKSILNSNKLKYNPAHWASLEKALHGNSYKKFIWRSVAAILLLLSVGIGFNKIGKQTQKVQNKIHKNNTTKSNLNGLSTTGRSKSFLNPNHVKNELSSKKDNNFKDSNNSTFVTGFNSNTKTPLSNLDAAYNNNSDLVENKKSTADQVLAPHLPLVELEIVKLELCNSMDLITKTLAVRKTKMKERGLHSGATLWLNFWENPALTGFYGKNNASAFYFNDWELIDENKDQKGELNFVQPLIYLAGYERRFGKYFSLGAYYKYQLKKNWNNRESNIYFSYSKRIFKEFNFRLGTGATFRNHNLAVNKLTLREKAINSDYIFTTDLGSLKSKNELSTTYHSGAFLSHKSFFVGYTAFNFYTNNISNENDVTLTKHCLTSGIHFPEYKHIKSSLLFKYEKELFKYYSPAIGLTFKDKIFTTVEYENLSNKKIMLGYNFKDRIKAQFTYSIRNLEDYQHSELNLDNFINRKGYIAAGLNYIF